MFRCVICLLLSIFYLQIKAQTVIPLYDQEIPNSRKVVNEEYSRIEPGNILIVYKVSRPSLTIFLAPKEKATGAAVIICPGGGYTNLAMGYEGTEVAQRFNESGISAFVLKYRIPNDETMIEQGDRTSPGCPACTVACTIPCCRMGNRFKTYRNNGLFCRWSPGCHSGNSFSKKLY